LIIHHLAVSHSGELSLLELWGHIIDLESLKLRSGHLKLVDIKQALVSNNGKLDEFPSVDIGINCNRINCRSILDEAAADHKT
jgi:hypothetical protein